MAFRARRRRCVVAGPVYSGRLFLRALVNLLVRRVATVDGLLATLAQETPEMQALRARLTTRGRFPSRPTAWCPLSASPLGPSSISEALTWLRIL
jgi:hypothetical protein